MRELNQIIINALIHRKKISIEDMNKSLLILAEQNKVLFELSNKNEGLEDINREGKVWIEKLRNTIIFTDNTLRDIPHVITRTYKYIPYVTYDIDLFVSDEDFLKTINIFKKQGCRIVSHDGSFGGRIKDQQKNIFKKGLLTIDLHRDFTWQKRRFIDKSILFDGVRKREIAGIRVDIPSPEVELLLCIADIGHERFNLTLLDLIWLEGLSKEIKKWNLITSQVRKYGWEKTFLFVSGIANLYSSKIYGREIIPNAKPVYTRSAFPFFLPIYACWVSYMENLFENKSFPWVSFAYMHFVKIRYYISGKKIMPYYSSWYQL